MILWSDDNISISMIFNNLTGQNFKADEYKAYIRNIAFGEMGFVPGTDVTVVTVNNGNVIVNVKEARVAISREMANKIMI